MSIDIKAPEFPESVADGTIATWYKKPGEAVKRDELIVDIETDKVVLEVVAPADGALENILKNEGDIVLSQEVIATFAKGAVAEGLTTQSTDTAKADVVPANANAPVSPAARKLAEEKNIDTATIVGTGKGGLVTKDDVQGAISSAGSDEPSPAKPAAPAVEDTVNLDGRPERRVPMTRMRARIAERLLTATQETAMLTTFNEVNMKPVMELRSRYKALFEKTHNGTRLGFMSLFVRAATEALKRFPAVNASIDGNDIVYHGYQDIGVAVSTDRGLVVPVLRDTNYMSLADIEAKIREYGAKGRDGKLSIDEITGGTFSITNGGVFGSMMSTPILNPPQAAILGMHAITERAMVVDGEVTVLPMMYLALSYDHRLIDGKEAVQFLVLIKELLEDPARILLDV